MSKKIDLTGFRTGAGVHFKRVPQEPGHLDVAFWDENGGVDEFRQVGWISMKSGRVWAIDDAEPVVGDGLEAKPLLVNMRGS